MITCSLSVSCIQSPEVREAWEGSGGHLLKAGRRQSVAARQCALVKATVTVVHAHAPALCTLHAAHCTLHKRSPLI